MSWNRNDSSNQRGAAAARKPRVPPVLLVPLVLLVLAVGVWLAVRGHAGRVTRPDREGRAPSRPIAEATPAAAQSGGQIAEAKPATGTNSPTPPATVKMPKSAVPKRMEEGVEVVSSTITTNSSGAVIEELVLADGKRMMKVQPPKPIFENACDQVIAMALSAKPGQSMPPLPNLDKSLEQDFINSLGSPIVISEDDPEEVKILKAQVKEAKAYLVDEIKSGGSLLEAIRNHQAEMERTADSHLMAIQEMQTLRSEYGEDAAREFIERVNESFRARGVPEIEFGRNQESGRRN